MCAATAPPRAANPATTPRTANPSPIEPGIPTQLTVKTPPRPQSLLARTRLVALASLTAVIAFAQKPVTAPAASADETVLLSPFQVAADADKGYQALNTLSGTRLNSKLEDLGSSITVVTKQQMTDLGLLDINDVFRYEASTEGTDNFTGWHYICVNSNLMVYFKCMRIKITASIF